MYSARKKKKEGQSHFYKDADNLVQIKSLKISLSTEEETRRAEIIHVLKCIESNYSSASTNGDGERFQAMFPDSQITKQFK